MMDLPSESMRAPEEVREEEPFSQGSAQPVEESSDSNHQNRTLPIDLPTNNSRSRLFVDDTSSSEEVQVLGSSVSNLTINESVPAPDSILNNPNGTIINTTAENEDDEVESIMELVLKLLRDDSENSFPFPSLNTCPHRRFPSFGHNTRGPNYCRFEFPRSSASGQECSPESEVEPYSPETSIVPDQTLGQGCDTESEFEKYLPNLSNVLESQLDLQCIDQSGSRAIWNFIHDKNSEGTSFDGEVGDADC